MIRQFNLNSEGFVKRKQILVHNKQEIHGLYIDPEEGVSPVFEVLYGETLIKHVDKNLQCEHNF